MALDQTFSKVCTVNKTTNTQHLSLLIKTNPFCLHPPSLHPHPWEGEVMKKKRER